MTCRARGRLKRECGEIVVGDLVSYTGIAHGEAIIEAVAPRRNLLRRPLVANVDQAVLVFALLDPEPNRLTIDRFLAAIMAENVPVALCLNKADLVGPGEAKALADYYRRLGYPVVVTSAKSGKGRRALLGLLAGNCSVICGPSGVGKSALINMLRPDLCLATGEISAGIRRGKHTTRAARLVTLPRGGFLVDTPGFTRVTLAGLDRARLAACFPEIACRAGQCGFRGCLHLAEPNCAIKQAVADGDIPAERYEHYRLFAAELAEKRR